jgi:peptide/nickel transport system substrate-binding protein
MRAHSEMPNLIHHIYTNFTKTERYIFWGSLMVLLTSGTLWGLLLIQARTIEIPVESRIYREGIIGQPVAVNPVIAGITDADRDLIELLFANLTDLAESYSSPSNGQTWNVVLQPDLRWSDGKPLTSDDVIFTVDTLQNPASRSPLFLTWQGVIIDRISEREIEFTLRNPYAFFLDNLKNLKIIPKHIFGNIPVENFRLSEYNLEPIGSGPYQFVSSEKRKDGFITTYRLRANEYFAQQNPFIKTIEVSFFASPTELISAFNKKDIDGFGGLNPKHIPNLRLAHKILEKTMPQYYAIFFNKNTKTSLADPAVLRAFELATNKQALTEKVFDGKALIINSPVPPMVAGYDRLADPGNEFSIEKANEILDGAKWNLNEETGIREKKTGRQTEILEYNIIVPQTSFLVDTVNILKEDWKQIGVNLNPIVLSPTDIANEVIKTRNYQMIIFGNILRNNPDIFSFWHSSERFYPGLNLSLYENKKVDNLLELVRKSLDENSRMDDLSRLQKLIVEDRPAIFLYSPLYLYVAPKQLGGFEEISLVTPSDRFKNVNKWYLETERVFK